MKRLFIYMLIIMLTAFVSNISAYESKTHDVFTGVVDITGTQVWAMEVALFNRSDDSAATEINWTGISIPVNEWRIADQYAKVRKSFVKT